MHNHLIMKLEKFDIDNRKAFNWLRSFCTNGSINVGVNDFGLVYGIYTFDDDTSLLICFTI